MKRTQKVILTIVLAVLSLSVLAGIQSLVFEPTPDTAYGMRQLQVTARTARHLIDALERYRHDHGSYPTTVTVLYPSYLHTPARHNRWNGWGYEVDVAMPSPQEYHLNIAVGRDPVLRYKHARSVGTWYYDPGNGAAETTLPF